MGTVKSIVRKVVKSATELFGKDAVELGDNAWKAWQPTVWQPLGVKDRTAQQRAASNGQGGTRAAMLAVMAYGFTDMAVATQAAAYIRWKHLGNTSTNTSGISYGWFTTYANMATVASNATFRADSKGTFKLAPINGKRAATVKAEPKATAPRKPSESRNGEVRIVRQSDKALADAQAAAMADIEASELGSNA
jgi:hypothetical protein